MSEPTVDAAGAAAAPALAVDEEKRVSWVELFFDLVFVFAVTEAADKLGHEPTWHGVLATFASFTPFWWSWVGTAMLANYSPDMDAVAERLRVFAAGGCTLLMTVAVPDVFGRTGWLFAAAYLVLRLVLAQWAFSGTSPWRWRASPYTWSLLVTAPLLLATTPLPADARIVAWAVIMIGEMTSSWLFRRRLADLRVNVSHLPERFGLVVIIALGESVVSAAAALEGHLDGSHVVALGLAWILACGLWWTYFTYSATAIARALAAAEHPSFVVRWLFSYGHYGLACAIIAIAVALEHAVHDPGAALHGEQWLLCGGAALYLAVFTWQRWLIHRTVSSTRLPAVALALALGLVASFTPGLVALALVAALFTGLAATEYALNR